ncbi:MAG: phosphatidylglycerophosphatase A [Kiritimatiellae bacterium]|nr:phosphatidylglycerophosphatase A [Kiritimatiellia bacterium]
MASDKSKVFLGSAFGLGLLPIMPGSFGALVGLAWHYVPWYLGVNDWIIRLWCLSGIVLFSIIHYRLTPWAQRYWNDPDPGHFVLDEVVGYLCVPLLALPETLWWHPLAGFALFRIFDIIKLPGARYIDRNIHTASGVLLDDVVDAAYAAVVLSLIIKFV